MNFNPSVIPAQAGIHAALPVSLFHLGVLDSRFRGNDAALNVPS